MILSCICWTGPKDDSVKPMKFCWTRGWHVRHMWANRTVHGHGRLNIWSTSGQVKCIVGYPTVPRPIEVTSDAPLVEMGRASTLLGTLAACELHREPYLGATTEKDWERAPDHSSPPIQSMARAEWLESSVSLRAAQALHWCHHRQFVYITSYCICSLVFYIKSIMSIISIYSIALKKTCTSIYTSTHAQYLKELLNDALNWRRFLIQLQWKLQLVVYIGLYIHTDLYYIYSCIYMYIYSISS